MKVVKLKNKNRVSEVVNIHMSSFPGFFLTFLGKGFLKQLYGGFIEHEGSGLLVAIEDTGRFIGFLAYSDDLSDFYKYLIKKHLISFAWFAGLGFLRKPKIFFRLLRALSYSENVKRKENYIELSSIGVLPEMKNKGIGSKLINVLIEKIDFSKYAYIKLETDAENNDGVNLFYQKAGFVIDHEYTTYEGRKMNEYRYWSRL